MHASRDRPSERHHLRRSPAVARGFASGGPGRGGLGLSLKPRTIFLGTPEFAVRSLDALKRLDDSGTLELVAVVTQPDRPANRGALREPPVKTRARDYGLPILQPARLHGGGLDGVLALRPELLVWAAYGNLVPRVLLDAVGGRAVNVHASLLPRWRGAAPIAHAILAGDRETGATLMEATVKLDAGPVIAQARGVSMGDATRGELESDLADYGAALLTMNLPGYLAGELRAAPQDEAGVTWAPKLDPRAGELDFARPAQELVRVVRAFTPDPGAFTTLRGQRIGVLRASVAAGPGSEDGRFTLRDGAPHVAAAAGWLRLDEVKPAGKRAMSGAEWARGLRLRGDERLPA